MSISSSRSDWRVALRLNAYGCEGEVSPISQSATKSTIDRPNHATRSRLGAHGELSEWYSNGPLGLEHGFLLPEAPCKAGGPVVLDIVVSGLTPRASTGGGVELIDHGGKPRVFYSDLSAVDAHGTALRSSMDVREGKISLRIDTRTTDFPISVDPLIWAAGQQLVPSDGSSSQRFADSVAVSRNTAIVSARDSSPKDGAYVYVRDGLVWTEQQKLVSPDGPAAISFGASVAISGDTAMVGGLRFGDGGSQHCVYVFGRTGNAWSLQQTLVADSSFDPGCISGDTAIMGAFGAALVYVRNGSTWSLQQTLVADDPDAAQYFGSAVAVSGDTAVVGSNRAYVNGQSDMGAVYTFTRNGTTWTKQQKLVAAEVTPLEEFGSSVSISGNALFVGTAPDYITPHHRAYAYAFDGSTWVEQQAFDLTVSDRYNVVSVVGSRALIAKGTAVDVYTLSANAWTLSQSLAPVTSVGTASLSDDTAVLGGYDGSYRTAHAYSLVPAGNPCQKPEDCALGYCSHGLCCDVDCSGACESCAAVNGAVADGRCTVLAAGSEGSPPCTALACTGQDVVCQPCTVDNECAPNRVCVGGACQARRASDGGAESGAGGAGGIGSVDSGSSGGLNGGRTEAGARDGAISGSTEAGASGGPGFGGAGEGGGTSLGGRPGTTGSGGGTGATPGKPKPLADASHEAADAQSDLAVNPVAATGGCACSLRTADRHRTSFPMIAALSLVIIWARRRAHAR